jgi:hypothetical protein
MHRAIPNENAFMVLRLKSSNFVHSLNDAESRQAL